MTNAFTNKIGANIEGELVIETHTAYQVAVAGKVVVLQKDDWSPRVSVPGFGNGSDNVFGQFFDFGGKR